MHHPPPEAQAVSNREPAYLALDEDALLALVSGGNQAAFAELVQRYTGLALRLATRTMGSLADAEDAVQTVFIKLWQQPNAWQAEKSAFSTWLYRVVLNACYDVQRKQRNSFVELDKAPEPQTPDLADIHDNDQQAALQQVELHRALKQLPATQRDAINLAVYLALPQKQVAAVLGVSVKAVESLLVRAKQGLRDRVNRAKPQIEPEL